MPQPFIAQHGSPLLSETQRILPIRTRPLHSCHAFLSHSFFAPFLTHAYRNLTFLSNPVPCPPRFSLSTFTHASAVLCRPIHSTALPCVTRHAFLSQHLLMPMLFMTLHSFPDPTCPHLSKPCFSLSTFYPIRVLTLHVYPIHSHPFQAMLFFKGETDGSN